MLLSVTINTSMATLFLYEHHDKACRDARASFEGTKVDYESFGGRSV